MIMKSKSLLRTVPLLFAAVASSDIRAQQSSQSVRAVQIIGLPAVKENAKGTLIVENGNLRFVHSKGISDISTSSIQDIVTGTDSQKAVGKTVGTISMAAAPYGGGRFLSLFRKKIDTLTVEYRDADGAFHGVIFRTPSGKADAIQKELIAQGAHTTLTSAHAETARPSTGSSPKEQTQ
jgi:hypothetical protein